MNEPQTAWENRIQTVASTLPYPTTPEVAVAVWEKMEGQHGRQPQNRARLAWAILLALVLVAGLLAVPQVRAAVLRFFQIGAITIFEVDNIAESVAEVNNTPIEELPMMVTPWPAPTPLAFTNFAKEVTWVEAQTMSPAPLVLPLYPANLGEPDHIYLQGTEWPKATIFTWEDRGNPGQTRLALYEIWADQYAYKGATVVEETTLNGRRAIWLEGPHFIQLQNGRVESWQFVAGSVLVWWADSGITYRLEGAESLAEAIRIAESLTPIEE